MEKQRLYHIIEWSVALAACGWLAWRLVTYDDYQGLLVSLRAMGWQQWLALAVCVALMPVNMALETWRWRTLMNEGATTLKYEEMSWREATRQVYYSKLAGLITPWRLGEYPARALLMLQHSDVSRKDGDSKSWARVLSMGAVGSATMTAAIVIAGLAGIAFSPSVLPYLGDSYLYALVALSLVLALLLALAPRALRHFAEVNHNLMIHSIFQSMVRLVCWCIQLALVLFALEAIGGKLSSIPLLPVYYLLVTITPNVPIMEIGVRGAWAIAVFGTMNAALAGVILWGINTLLPCLVWLFIKKLEKR